MTDEINTNGMFDDWYSDNKNVLRADFCEIFQDEFDNFLKEEYAK